MPTLRHKHKCLSEVKLRVANGRKDIQSKQTFDCLKLYLHSVLLSEKRIEGRSNTYHVSTILRLSMLLWNCACYTYLYNKSLNLLRINDRGPRWASIIWDKWTKLLLQLSPGEIFRNRVQSQMVRLISLLKHVYSYLKKHYC